MLLRYFYDEKLAHASYLVGCQATGEAIVIDPARDVTPYLKTAQAEGLTVVAAAETHIHADFVSGAREMGAKHKATLYVSGEGGPDWSYAYVSEENGHQLKHCLVKDGDRFNIGRLEFEVLHTPGHTPESVSFLLTDRGGGADRPIGIFTGDFVFVGDVGRPDLLEKAVGLAGTAMEGARLMFQSLQRFKRLDEYVQIWPAHGAGSACGKALGAVPSSTVGYEKRFNWALSFNDEPSFVDALLAGQPEPPTYFPRMKQVNREGPALLTDLPAPEWIEGTVVAVVGSLVQRGATVIDTRTSPAFAAGHVEGTINLPYNRSFTSWAGWLVDDERPLYVMGEADQLPGIVRDMRAIGIDRIAGTIEASAMWSGAQSGVAGLQSYAEVTPADIAGKVSEGEVVVVDVRSGAEWEEGRIPGARHILLGTLPQRIREVPADKPVLVQCRTGMRSAIAAGIMQAHGIANVMNLQGGIVRWREEGLPIAK
ncbi:MBL fold metallo-hydrolase [Paenibacillus sp. MER TA 81-3]|uniref:MBL fold metallo-hydrolase n=1 Tax=Paenibacillus sp. MER TA 81-3 TaxID=2939573 RepID=UPI00203BC729|nr:MBL fold metallo-hydrolase [Paenibacillus sp. MER TA 81-3]MCM3340363.1 MBL fold metallo-hydrolase [Paenibacillus sp. MER TA 81-3]